MSLKKIVAVFMTAWIEITDGMYHVLSGLEVAVFMTAWIEIQSLGNGYVNMAVAVFMTAWIEIWQKHTTRYKTNGCSLHDCMD